MQPVHTAAGRPDAGAATSLNSAAFWNKRSEDVAVEDVFFHEYFSKMGKAGQDNRKKNARKEQDGEGESEAEAGSEAGEDEIWQALVNSRPDVEGDSDSDGESDAEFNDLMGLDDSDDEMDDAASGEAGSDDEDDDSDGLEGLLDDEDDEDDPVVESHEADEAEGKDGEALRKDVDQAKKPESAHKARRRALKNLPMFASVDDYADMLAQEEDGM